jgi:RNA-directed DNA polymerase
MGKGVTGIRSSQRKHVPDIVGLDKDMQTSLRRIAHKARKDRRHRFQNLYRMLDKAFLEQVFHSLNKKAASGVDQVSFRDYEANLDTNLQRLVENLKQRRYRAKLVRRKNIPKGKGRTRPLGIPAIEDKLLQTAVSQILQAIYEQDFLPCSYGYRPDVGARDAVEALSARLQFGKFGYVIEADIKSFFDRIEHNWLLRMLEERVDDRPFLQLIRKWLKAGVLEEDGEVILPEAGTPQGGSVSPVLANIYLHYALDLWFEKVVKKHCQGEVLMVRYADDYVCLFQYQQESEQLFRELPKRLAKFGLELAPDKTQILRFSRFRIEHGKRFCFLGFEFYWGTSRKGKAQLYARTSRKKLQSSVAGFSDWCKRHRHLGNRKIFAALNAKLRGHYNYFGVRCNYKRLRSFYYRVLRVLQKWLNRRSQRRSCNWEKFWYLTKLYRVERPRIVIKPRTQLLLPC